jgi:hypothetical protein
MIARSVALGWVTNPDGIPLDDPKHSARIMKCPPAHSSFFQKEIRNAAPPVPNIMAIADILLIGYEVISTILTISWTFLNTLFEALQVIYIEHHNNSNSTADDS